MEIPIVGGAYLGRSSNLNAQVCQNLYPILGGPGGKKVVALANTPGLTEFASLGEGEIRALDVMGDYLFFVKGDRVYKVDEDGDETLMDGVLNTSSGKVWMGNNGSQIMIVDNPYGYILGEIKALGILTLSALPYEGDTIIIDETTYTLREVLTPTRGSEIITNGDFDSDLTGWAGANWAWSNGTALHSAGAATALTQAAATVVIGRTYLVEWKVVGGTAGTVRASLGGANGGLKNSGTRFYREVFTATATTAFAVTPSTDFDGAVDLISMREIINETPITEGEILIGDNIGDTITNIFNAINHDVGNGIVYNCAAAHPSVEAVESGDTTLTVRALVGGEGGNSIATTEVSEELSWGADTLLGGVDDTTLSLISDEDFPAASSLTYQDGYFIITKVQTGRFYLSDSYDGRSWDALLYATAEADPDNLVGCVSASRLLWLIGVESYEIWYNSGDPIFPFDRIEGSFNKIGCNAVNSIAEFQGTVAWLDHHKNVRVSQGYSTVKISTEQIDFQIGQYTVTSDAIGFFYTQEGHIFYVLTFPTEEKTWVYDFTTQLWHTRASDSSDKRHRANCAVNFKGMTIVGDYENGKLYKYDLSKYSDDGVMLRRIRTAQAFPSQEAGQNRKYFFHGSLEVEFEAGVGLTVDDPDLERGKDPEAILQWSDDGGHTWSNEHWVHIGKIGEYGWRAIWRKLGRSRDRIYRVIVTDPVKVVIIGAYLEAQGGTA
jgi:hypothetical protein